MFTKRVVALKLIVADRAWRGEAADRFKQEIAAGGKLSPHPHVIQTLDAGEFEGQLFLVMEYLEGTDVGRVVQNVGPLPIADACEIARQTALAIQHIQQKNLVHRDIKPSNLLLTRQGQVKLLDLGLVRMHEHPGGEGLTTSGQVMGSVDYMVPEQAQDSHHVDTRADIYSLGATLYKLISGKAPFDDVRGSNPVKKLVAIASTPVPALASLRPDVPAALASLVHEMLGKSPNDRPGEALEVAARLQPFTVDACLSDLLSDLKESPPMSTPATRNQLEPTSREHARGRPSRSSWPWVAWSPWILSLAVLAAVIAVGMAYRSWSASPPAYPTGVVVLRFDEPPTDAELDGLRNHATLKRIDFGDRPLFNVGRALEVAATLPQLTHLRMNGILLDDKTELNALARCIHLEELILLDALSLVDGHMWCLRDMNNLKKLHLPGSNLSGWARISA